MHEWYFRRTYSFSVGLLEGYAQVDFGDVVDVGETAVDGEGQLATEKALHDVIKRLGKRARATDGLRLTTIDEVMTTRRTLGDLKADQQARGHLDLWDSGCVSRAYTIFWGQDGT